MFISTSSVVKLVAILTSVVVAVSVALPVDIVLFCNVEDVLGTWLELTVGFKLESSSSESPLYS